MVASPTRTPLRTSLMPMTAALSIPALLNAQAQTLHCRSSPLRSILKAWAGHYNRGRPHMSLGPGVPDPPTVMVPSATQLTRHRIGERLGVRARSVLGGLHHEYLLAPALA